MSIGEIEVREWVDRNPGIHESIVTFAYALAIEASFDQSASNNAVLDIMRKILEAEGEEAVFEAANAGTLSGKDFADKPFRLKSDGIQWKGSAAMFREQGGFPFYALVRVTHAISPTDPEPLTCGGWTVVTTLWSLAQQGILAKYDDDGGMPLVLKARKAASGFDFLTLQSAHAAMAPQPKPTKRAPKTS